MNGVVMTVLSLVVVLGVLVFVHELGHFLAAKWAGIRVLRFSIGMGTPIRALTRMYRGTEYTVSWLPLGGYVKMASREEMAADALEGGAVDLSNVPDSETFEAAPIWKRMVVIMAGVFLNAVFAWLVFSGVFYQTGRASLPITTVGDVADSLPAGAEALRDLPAGARIESAGGVVVTSWNDIALGIQNAPGDSVVITVAGGQTVVLPIHRDALGERTAAALALEPWRDPIIGDVVAGRPAAKAGIAAGDTLLTINGVPVIQWYDLVDHLDTLGGREVTVTVGRAAGRLDLALTPETVTDPDGTERQVGRIGATNSTPDPIYTPLSLGEAVVAGGRSTLETSTLIVRLVRGMFTGRVSTREVGGPITIAQSAAASASQGPVEFLLFMALISVNLAVVNLLPIPVLDGGQFLFLLGEAVIRRPLPVALRQALSGVGLVLVVLLMVLALSNDLRRIFGF
ncbi:MAG: RIP metalloprotease RseP [Gemmatimonadota bacterium]